MSWSTRILRTVPPPPESSLLIRWVEPRDDSEESCSYIKAKWYGTRLFFIHRLYVDIVSTVLALGPEGEAAGQVPIDAHQMGSN